MSTLQRRLSGVTDAVAALDAHMSGETLAVMLPGRSAPALHKAPSSAVPVSAEGNSLQSRLKNNSHSRGISARAKGLSACP